MRTDQSMKEEDQNVRSPEQEDQEKPKLKSFLKLNTKSPSNNKNKKNAKLSKEIGNRDSTEEQAVESASGSTVVESDERGDPSELHPMSLPLLESPATATCASTPTFAVSSTLDISTKKKTTSKPPKMPLAVAVANKVPKGVAAANNTKKLFDEAIKKVLQAEEQKNKPVEDPLGDSLTVLLNRHPDFSHKSRRRRRKRLKMNAYDAEDGACEYDEGYNVDDTALSFQIPPIISRNNLRFVGKCLRRCVRPLLQWRELPTRLRNRAQQPSRWLYHTFIAGENKECFDTRPATARPSLKHSLLFFCFWLLLSAVADALLYHVSVLWSVQATIKVATFVLLCLVDWHDWKDNCCPRQLQQACQNLGNALTWFDLVVLQGRRFRGREWNAEEDDFEFDHPDQADSLNYSLSELPPPSIRQGRRLALSPDFLARQEWSRHTVNHIVAVDFCYVMLREAELRRQAKRQEARQRNGNSNNIEHNNNIEKTSDFIEEKIVSTNPRRLVTGTREKEFATVGAPAYSANTQPGDNENDGDNVLTNSSKNNHLTEDSSVDDSISSELAADMAWIDVGAKIGRRLLNSSHVQRAMTSHNTRERIMGISKHINNMQEGNDLSEGGGESKMRDVVPSAESEQGIIVGRTATAANTDWSGKLERHEVFAVEDDYERTTTSGDLDNYHLPKPIHSIWAMTSAVPESPANSIMSFFSSDSSIPPEQPSQTPLPSPPNSPHLTWGRSLSPSSLTQTMTTPGRSRPPLSPRNELSKHSNSYRARSPVASTGTLSEQGFVIKKLNDDSGAKVSQSQFCIQKQDTTTLNSSPSRNKLPPNPRNVEKNTGRTSDCFESLPKDTLALDRNKFTRGVGGVKKSPKKQHIKKRMPLLPGTKIAVPINPLQPWNKESAKRTTAVPTNFQMGTVVSSERIYIGGYNEEQRAVPNALSVTVKLDKCFLRNGRFSELTFRVKDEWAASRYMPKHSAVPVGSCVATTYGLGVLVGWRVRGDCHVIRSLWQRRGHGSAHAYLNRSAIHSIIEAAVGFKVQTRFGWGIVLAYVNGGTTFTEGSFLVAIKEDGKHNGYVLELKRQDIFSCLGAQFIPVIEHVREAAHYQLQVDDWKTAIREQKQRRSGARNHATLTALESVDPNHIWTPEIDELALQNWSACADILWTSFLSAVEEDDDFDEGVNEFTTSLIEFLERLDGNHNAATDTTDATERLLIEDRCISSDFEVECVAVNHDESGHGTSDDASKGVENDEEGQAPGFWIVNDFFGGIFGASEDDKKINDDFCDNATGVAAATAATTNIIKTSKTPSYYDRSFAILRTIMKTVSLARAASVDFPRFHLSLAIFYDFLLFVRTIVKVQQKNVSSESIEVWKRCVKEIVETFGPIKDRLTSIGQGIALRMERQGRRAKIRALDFVDIILSDEKLLLALEHGEWDQFAVRLEIALVESKIVKDENLQAHRKMTKLMYDHIRLALNNKGASSKRNNEKLAILGQAVQWIANPRKSVLKLFHHDDVLEFFERILVRVFYKDELASRMLMIHASNFTSLRHFRMLKDFSVAGRIWMPLLDAADEEFSWVVSRMPDSTKEFMHPISSLFSMCVEQFRKIDAGDHSKDWLDFLLEEDAVQIIHDLDMKVLLNLEAFSRDVREMMVVLPYYDNIDLDILNLMDEVNLDELLIEFSDAIDDADKLAHFIREKSTMAIEKFLNYLPKMSIPVEKRDLGDGWVLTCRGEDGGDLTLSDVNIKRENLVCQIMGGEVLYNEDNEDVFSYGSSLMSAPATVAASHHHQQQSGVASNPTANGDAAIPSVVVEESILDQVRELLLQAEQYGCWKTGIGGVVQSSTDPYVATVLQGLPLSAVLNCAIELWRNLEIDDDELLEIAIRDVSFQIQLQKEREESAVSLKNKRHGSGCEPNANDISTDIEKRGDFGETNKGQLMMTGSWRQEQPPSSSDNTEASLNGLFPSTSNSTSREKLSESSSFDTARRRFNPRADPTVLYLEMKNLTLHLDKFLFRIEKHESKRTIFDPTFDGQGMLLVRNVSIRLRVECAKERVRQKAAVESQGGEVLVPILHLRELTVELEKVKMKVKDTGFGSDWILNRAVHTFQDSITKIVEENLKEQIFEQIKQTLENLNSYFRVNPNALLNLLGISIDDLEENVVWV